MKYISLFLLFSVCLSCFAQDNTLLVEQQQITNLSEFPFYQKVTEENNDNYTWKTEYQYMDSIEVYAITYMSDGLKVNGFLVKPKVHNTYPCLIYNRGGNREFGGLTVARAALLLGRYAKEGYIVIASQYRGNGGSEGMEEFGGIDVNDVTILPKVLKEIQGADTERIGMYGHSRGGMMTYIALPQMNNIKAAVVTGGVSDSYLTIADRPEMESVYAELVPNYVKNKDSELTKRSAIQWADQFSQEVPVLIMHGNADWRVNPEQSLRMAMEFEKYRVPYRLIMFEGADHGISEHKQEVQDQIIDWFDKYVKNDEPLPNMEFHGR